ncbi:hypothetical protein F480_08635 [Bibersteinia trehalosi Y31]|uniref:Uncharacterized protein n=1 Tax=Bibersteinia trehalosi Y31 TaxID=1261658 RepID=A0A179CZA3_BIBTR|nr:hypothetical protein F480_08635 [Bibersteinia trehalosi Y31]
MSLKNDTIKEENVVNGVPLYKFSDAECVIFKHNPAGLGGFLPKPLLHLKHQHALQNKGKKYDHREPRIN